MASHLLFLLFIFFSLASAQASNAADALFLPIMKDGETLQYTTRIDQGTPPLAMQLVIDLGGPLLWTDCKSSHLSSSYMPALCNSLQCSTANANKCGTNFRSAACGLLAKNTVTGKIMNGELGEDVITFGSMATVDHFLFSCAPTFLFRGLASGTRGIVGLGRNRISLPSQLAGVLGYDRKFSICLPSSTESQGFIFFNTDPYIRFVQNTGTKLNTLAEIAKSLMYTPLITKGVVSTHEDASNEYYIGVKSIKLNGRQLSLNASLLSIKEDGEGGTRLSTVVPFTILEDTIYNELSTAFTEAASSSFNMTRVASVAPFDVCFSSKNIARKTNGPVVPAIDLVLQSSMVKWRIHGGSSMVQMSEEVMCLGFLNGGLNARDSIVIGGYQLENNLLEFDLASSRMGFTSLLARQIGCSNFNLYEESLRSL